MGKDCACMQKQCVKMEEQRQQPCLLRAITPRFLVVPNRFSFRRSKSSFLQQTPCAFLVQQLKLRQSELQQVNLLSKAPLKNFPKSRCCTYSKNSSKSAIDYTPQVLNVQLSRHRNCSLNIFSVSAGRVASFSITLLNKEMACFWSNLATLTIRYCGYWALVSVCKTEKQCCGLTAPKFCSNMTNKLNSILVDFTFSLAVFLWSCSALMKQDMPTQSMSIPSMGTLLICSSSWYRYMLKKGELMVLFGFLVLMEIAVRMASMPLRDRMLEGRSKSTQSSNSRRSCFWSGRYLPNSRMSSPHSCQRRVSLGQKYVLQWEKGSVLAWGRSVESGSLRGKSSLARALVLPSITMSTQLKYRS